MANKSYNIDEFKKPKPTTLDKNCISSFNL